MKKLYRWYIVLLVVAFSGIRQGTAQGAFIHPGGLLTLEDLNRMKEKVAEKAHPWIDGWNLLIQDPLAANTYLASPKENMNLRQLMSKDAHAAYLNALRWYISGDKSYADCAVRIFNDYSATVNQIPSGQNNEFVGLGGISISELAMAAEVMRIYPGWDSKDFEQFKTMMLSYFYPVCHDFLTNHNGACIDYYWTNWDANNILSLVAIGVLCDNREIYNEGIEYFYNGAGTGSIQHAVYHTFENGLGQWQESGRDQEHAQLGVGLLGYVCQIAWNQGLDLFAYDNNRLLAGAEYTAKYNQNQDVPFIFYNNCQPANNKWAAINGRGRLDDRPVWELLYNHYVVRKGLNAPYTKRMAELMRPEHGSKDHFGYGTLTFTLKADSSPYPAYSVPGKPANLKATAGAGKVFLTWDSPSDYTATGYEIQRATGKNGQFTTIASWDANTYTVYTDENVDNGTGYLYRVAGVNQSGRGDYSSLSGKVVPCEPAHLPHGWTKAEIATPVPGKAAYAPVAGSTFIVRGSGTKIGGTSDEATYCFRTASGDFEISCRISNISGPLAKTGLMIRESLNPDSPCVTMTLGEGGGRFARMGYRKTTGENMASTLGNAYTWLPAWFKIKKEGNRFTAYESSDGARWFKVDSVEIQLASFYLGFVATSRGSESVTSTFDHVEFKQAFSKKEQ